MHSRIDDEETRMWLNGIGIDEESLENRSYNKLVSSVSFKVLSVFYQHGK
jgi:hypothetical protein